MPANAFIGSPKPPTDEGLTSALGGAKVPWDRLLADPEREFGLTRK